VVFTLAQRIYRFERWRDCTPLDKDIAYWPGVILETSAFGMESIYPEAEDPWTDHGPIVSSSGDIARLRAAFDPRNGLVKRIMEMSEYCRKALPEFSVHVQAWERSALGIAMDLMGCENFLVNTITEPLLVHELMRRVTDAGRAWSEQRNAYLTKRGFPLEIGRAHV
jgi:uroporphyrinogen-III decarboxylase